MVKLNATVAALAVGIVLEASCLSLPTQCSKSSDCGSGAFCDCNGFCRADDAGVVVTGCADGGTSATTSTGTTSGATTSGTTAGATSSGTTGTGTTGGTTGGSTGTTSGVFDAGPCLPASEAAPARSNLTIAPWAQGTQSGFLLMGGVGPAGCTNSPLVNFFQTSPGPVGYQSFAANLLNDGTTFGAGAAGGGTAFIFGGKKSGGAAPAYEYFSSAALTTTPIWFDTPSDIAGPDQTGSAGFLGTFGASAIGTALADAQGDIAFSVVGGDLHGQSTTASFNLIASPAGNNGWDVDCANAGCSLASGLTPRESFGLVAKNDGTLVAMGGAQIETQGQVVLDDVQILTPGAGSWAGGPALEDSRAYFVAAIDESQTIYAIGGTNNPSEVNGLVASMEVLTPDAGSWALGTPPPNGGRIGAVGAYDSVTNRIYVFMGLVTPPSTTNVIPDNGYDIYDVDAGTWQNCWADGGCVTCEAGSCPPH